MPSAPCQMTLAAQSVMKEFLHLPRDGIRKVRRAARRHFFPVLPSRDGNLKLPPALFLDSVCRASRGGRIKLFRRLLPYLAASAPATSTEVCEINSLAEFESGYARLADMLGHAGKTPPSSEIEFLRDNWESAFVVSRHDWTKRLSFPDRFCQHSRSATRG